MASSVFRPTPLRPACLSLLLLLLLPVARSLELTIAPSQKKCFIEDVTRDTLIVSHYHIIDLKKEEDTQDNFLSQITDPSGTVIWETHALDIDYSFTSEKTGEYRLCIWNHEETPHLIDLTFVSGVEAKDFREVAKVSDLHPLQRELNRIGDTLYEIKLEIEVMKDKEGEMRDINESISARIMWSSLFSLVVLVSLSIWQSCYMREYLREKKLI